MTRLAQLRRATGGLVLEGLFRGLSAVGRFHPMSRPERHGVEVLPDIPYQDSGLAEHRLDVYRPVSGAGPRPVVLYVHGGAFRILSKESHWIMALAFARRGFVVFNISYRLAPKHPFPAAIEDACRAYAWVVRHAAQYGGDPAQIVLAGESAGANLVTSLTLATCYDRPEPFARDVFDLGLVPRAVIPACGILQVSDPGRFTLPTFLMDRLTEIRDAYLHGVVPARPEDLDLADPVVALERNETPVRPLPPFFAPVGTRDFLIADTRRLAAALEALGTPCEARYYEGELHAFHALVFRENARRCWQDSFEFLGRQLPGPIAHAAPIRLWR